MHENKEEFCIARIARVWNVSESGYYKWQQIKGNGLSEKEQADHALAEESRELFIGSWGSYGCRKVTRILNARKEEPINHKRVEHLMKEKGLFSKTCKKYIPTTDSRHAESIAENLIDRDFEATRPNEKTVSDTTVVRTKQGCPVPIKVVSYVSLIYSDFIWPQKLFLQPVTKALSSLYTILRKSFP